MISRKRLCTGLGALAAALLALGLWWTVEPRISFYPHKMDEAEVEHWLNDKLAAGTTPRFAALGGKIPCCDRPDLEARFLPDHMLEMRISGFVAERKTLRYSVRKDGLIALDADANSETRAWLLAQNLRAVFAFQYRAETYLLRENEPAFNIFLERSKAPWPLEYLADP